MTFNIEIRRYKEPDEKGYRSSDSIYEQEVEDLDVASVIAVINNLTKKRRRKKKE